MIGNSDELKGALERMKGNCRTCIQEAKEILATAKDPKLAGVVEKQADLYKALEDVMGRIEKGLLPGLEAATEQHAAVAAKTSGGMRRSTPRYKRRVAIRYRVVGRDTRARIAFSRDIGAMGLFIVTDRSEKVGNPLELEVELPGEGRVMINATVVWSKWVPQSLRAVEALGGFGVRIHSAPESWFSYFLALEESDGGKSKVNA